MAHRVGIPTGFQEPNGKGPWFGYLEKDGKKRAVRVWPTVRDGGANPVLDEILEAQDDENEIIVDGYTKQYNGKPQFYATDLLSEVPDGDDDPAPRERSFRSSKPAAPAKGKDSKKFVGREPGTADFQTRASIALSFMVNQEREQGRAPYHLDGEGNFAGFTPAVLGGASALILEANAIAALLARGELEAPKVEAPAKRRTAKAAEKAVKEAFFDDGDE